jgi:hypothetical protein
MTDASKWRLEMARKIAPVYAEDPRVEAIAVGGSVGRGCADRWSDVEIGVYWREEPSAEERRAMTERFGILDGDPKPFSLDDDDPGSEESDDDVYVGGGVRIGTNVELKHKTIAAVNTFMDKWDREGTLPGMRFPETMQTAVAIYNADLIRDWKKKCAVYPDGLVSQEIDTSLEKGGLRSLRQLAEEEDYISQRRLAASLVVGVINTLCAINRHYTPSWKWNEWTLSRLGQRPEGLWGRLQQLFEDPTQAPPRLESILDDCAVSTAGYGTEWERIRVRLEAEAKPGSSGDALKSEGEARIGEALEGFQWSWSNRVSFYCYRGDMFHHAMFVRRSRQLLRLLGALNGVPEETSSFHWLSILPTFERVPEGLEERFRASFTPDLPEGQQQLDSLIEESLLLARDCYDVTTVDRHLAHFRGNRRPAWDGPPVFDL